MLFRVSDRVSNISMCFASEAPRIKSAAPDGKRSPRLRTLVRRKLQIRRKPVEIRLLRLRRGVVQNIYSAPAPARRPWESTCE